LTSRILINFTGHWRENGNGGDPRTPGVGIQKGAQDSPPYLGDCSGAGPK